MYSNTVNFSMRALLALLIIVALGCAPRTRSISHLESESPRLFLSTAAHPRGVFLLVHGLNLKPSALDTISSLLAKNGFHSYRMTLSGHNESSRAAFDESVWVEDVRRAYLDIRHRFKHLPTFIAGYSLGGLLATHSVDSLPKGDYPNGMVLLAPALSLRSFPELASTLGLPPPLSLEIPNLAPRPYRRYPYTPLFWYSNTLTIYRQTQHLQHPHLLALTPTLIFLNPRDELISPSGTRAWLEENGLASTWSVRYVRPAITNPLLAEHLIIDPDSVGIEEWLAMQAAIEEFLNRLTHSAAPTSAIPRSPHPPTLNERH